MVAYIHDHLPSVKAKNLLGSLGLTGTLAILCVETVLMMMGFGLISPILPLYAESLGANVTMVGFLITVYGLARLIIDIPAGSLTGKWGCRPILIAGPIMLTIGSVASGLANNYWQLLISRFIQGTGSAMFTTSAMVMLFKISTPANRARVISYYQGSLLVGTGLGPVLGGVIAQYFGLRAPFFVYAFLSLMGCIWAYLRLPEPRLALPQKLPEVGSYSDPPPAILRTGFTVLLRDLNFILVSTLTIGFFFTLQGAQNQMLPLIADARLGLSPGQIGTALTIISVLNMPIILVIGRLSDRFGRKVLITPGFLITAAAVAMLSQVHAYWTLLLCCVIWGIGTGISGPVPAAYVADILPRENYGKGMGLYRAIGDLGVVIGPALMGWLADMKGFSFSLFFNAAFILLATLCFHILAKEPR